MKERYTISDDYLIIFNSNNEIDEVEPEPKNTFESSEVIGRIDEYGIFVIDLLSEGIELQSYTITDDAGFFDKIIIESNYKAWVSNMKHTYEVFQDIYGWIYQHSRYKILLLKDRIASYDDEERFSNYLENIDVTWFNNPIVANQ